MNAAAERLLEAHVEHELAQLKGERLQRLLDGWATELFAWFERVTFNDITTRDAVVGVIDRQVIELKVSGGITELAGEMAAVVFGSRATVETPVSAIIPGESYEDFAEKIVGLEALQRDVAHRVLHSPAFASVTGQVVSRIVVALLFEADDEQPPSALKELLARVRAAIAPELEPKIATIVARYVEKQTLRFVREGEGLLLDAIDPRWVRQIVDDLWDGIASRPLADATTSFGSQDLEDFVVLVYEFWLRFRKTPYFRTVIGELVDHLFAKYGDESVHLLISDMGVTRDIVALELRAFGPRLIEHAIATGFAREQIRRHLEGFYRSPAASEILGG